MNLAAFINGIAVGGVAALLAVGISQIFTTSGVLNFAHAGFAMLAAYLYAWLTVSEHWSVGWAALATVAVVSLLGTLAEWLVLRRLAEAPFITKVIVTLGLYVFMQGVTLQLFGFDPKKAPLLFHGGVKMGSTVAANQQIAILGAGLALMAGLALFLRGTRLGLATRSCAQDRATAGLIGIPTRAVSSVNWTIGAFMAAVAGVLIAPLAVFTVDSFSIYLVTGIGAALFGGLTGLTGAFLGGLVLEPHQPVGQHPALGQLFAYLVLNGPEIFADDHRAGSIALERHDVEQLVTRKADVGAVRRFAALGDPEQTEQPHHVIDPERTAMVERGAHGLHERLVSNRAQLPRDERRESPILAFSVERVRGRADTYTLRDRVLPHPGVRAARIEADGQVAEQCDLCTGRGELVVEQPLDPGVKAKPVVLRRGETRDARTVGPSVLGGPRGPATAVALGQRAIQCELTQRTPAARDVGAELGIVAKCRPEKLEGRQLERIDLIAVDDSLVVEGSTGFGRERERLVAGREAWNVLDTDVQRVAEPTAARKVRARILLLTGLGGMQRVDAEDAGPEAGRPSTEHGQVA